MKTFVPPAFLLILALFALPSHAQEVYPCAEPGPGEVVVGQTDAVNGVAAMQLCKKVQTPGQAAPAQQWESRWGAIASAPNGTLGSATGMASRSAAESGALSDCKSKGGEKCELETWFSNGCAAVVVGDGGYNVTSDSTIDAAIAKGMKFCTDAKRSNCHVYFQTCSPPVRVH